MNEDKRFTFIRDKTIGEIFDNLCLKYDETNRIEQVGALFKGRHPVTNEIMSLKMELIE